MLSEQQQIAIETTYQNNSPMNFNTISPQLFIDPPAQNFNQYYQLHTAFLQNLRKQSHKIQQLLKYTDQLKQELNRKQQQLQKFRSKQNSAANLSLLRQQEIRDEYIDKIKLLRQRLNDMEAQNQNTSEENRMYKKQIQTLKRNSQNMINTVKSSMVHNFSSEQQHRNNNVNKIKLVLSNCKQQNTVLRLELQKMQQSHKQLESAIRSQYRKLDNKIEEYQHQIQKLNIHITMKNKQLLQQRQHKQQLEVKLGNMEENIFIKLDSYDQQIKEMIRNVQYYQYQKQQYRGKYQDLIKWVNWIDLMRQQVKIGKYTDKLQKTYFSDHINLLKDRRSDHIKLNDPERQYMQATKGSFSPM